MNSDRYCSSNNAPTESFSLLFTFGWKRNSPASKSISPSVIPAVPWRIQGFLQSIKGTSSSFFSRSNWVETQESTSEIVSIYKSCNLTFSSHIAKWQPEFVTRWPQSAFYFHVSRWPQSALSFFLYFRIVCNLPPFGIRAKFGRSVVSYCLFSIKLAGSTTIVIHYFVHYSLFWECYLLQVLFYFTFIFW